MKVCADRLGELAGEIDRMLKVAQVPGAALGIVSGNELVFAKGYGYRDWHANLPMDAQTVYPIASTTKAINATLLAMLVEEGILAWDVPVQRYLPQFRLGDAITSTHTTLRDLILMRTGLPRHDWLWLENRITRAQIIERLPYLDLSAGFRERFQYNNLTATTAGHIAEVATGRSWEQLIKERILDLLGMHRTEFIRPSIENVTLSYHAGVSGELVPAKRFCGEVTAPSGGAIYSTIEDMARWVAFNLGDGGPLLQSQSLAEIHSPQIMVGADPSGPSPYAAYALGWFVDSYQGWRRMQHGGFLHDVHSLVALFPEKRVGFVAFTNAKSPKLSSIIVDYAAKAVLGFAPMPTFDQLMTLYENVLSTTRERNQSLRRIEGTSPSHDLGAYVGRYSHPGYGELEISKDRSLLIFRRNNLTLPLAHWHYDAWVAVESDFFENTRPHSFDHSNRFLFEASVEGNVAALTFPFEPAVDPIRFVKQ